MVPFWSDPATEKSVRQQLKGSNGQLELKSSVVSLRLGLTPAQTTMLEKVNNQTPLSDLSKNAADIKVLEQLNQLGILYLRQPDVPAALPPHLQSVVTMAA